MADTPPQPPSGAPPPPPPPQGAPPFAAPPPPGHGKGPIGDLGTWFSESFRLMVDRTGHFLPMVVVFLLPVGLLTAFALFYGLENSSMTIDSEAGTADWAYSGSSQWLAVAALLVPVWVVLIAVVKAAMVRQVWAAQSGVPEPWSDSLNGSLARAGRVIPVALGRIAVYTISWVLLSILLAVPLLALLTPVVVIWMFAVWVTLSFIGPVSALSGQEHRAFRTSIRLARLQLGPLIGRLVLLALVGASLIVAFGFVGAPFTAIAGRGEGGTLQFGAETIEAKDVFGTNPMAYALGSVFSVLGFGAYMALTMAGTTLLYRNLGGPTTDTTAPEADPMDNTAHRRYP